MRFYITSFLIAAFSLVSFAFVQFTGHIETAYVVNLDLPGFPLTHIHKGLLPVAIYWMLYPLSECFHYMTVTIHEPGHALAYWLFGSPALPVMDAVHGGGVTYSIGRSHAVLAFVYALMAAGGGLLAQRSMWRGLAVLAVFAALHVALLVTGYDYPLAIFAGHGMEIAVCCWCITRATRVEAPLPKWERYITMIFGLHLMGRVVLLPLALIFVNARRMTYGMQKGTPGSADLDKFARELGLPMEGAAWIMLAVFAAAMTATLVYIARRGARRRAKTCA
ncbi:MAG: M50 family metallopeptidase [Alphaproteobacteria bacterium]|nr:M50 family metallopeptidase [Alphaproteobacteria bacterium]